MKWTEKEEETLKKLYGLIPIFQISKKINNRSKASIWKRAKILGLKSDRIKMIRICKTKYKHNRLFFKKPNQLNSYWAGFLAADGWITLNRGQYCLGLKLQISDINRVKKFCKDIGFNGKIRIVKNKMGNKVFKYAAIVIWGATEIVNDLKNNFNLCERKSLTLQPPYWLNNKNSLAFIIGLFDGDGCITRYKQKHKYKYVEVVFSGTKAVLMWIRGKIDPNGKTNVRKQGSIFRYCLYGDSSAKNFYNLVKNIKVPKMMRKWRKFNE